MLVFHQAIIRNRGPQGPICMFWGSIQDPSYCFGLIVGFSEEQWRHYFLNPEPYSPLNRKPAITEPLSRKLLNPSTAAPIVSIVVPLIIFRANV